MFGTRLIPTKPPAAHRAVLERVGAACRKIRADEDTYHNSNPITERVHAVLAEHGLFKIGIESEYGGVGTEPMLSVLASERLGREGFGLVHYFVCHHAFSASAIARWGTEAQKGTLLGRAASGDSTFRFAHEATSSINFELATDRYLLNGHTQASMKPTTTDSLIVLANDRCGGMSTAFLVDISQRGVRIRPTAKDAVGPNAFSWDIELLDCEVPQANLLGELGNGHQILSTAQMNARLGISAGTLGVMADCLESIAAFTSDRIKRAEGPSAREAVERYVARTATDLEAARGLVYAAAELKVDYDRRPTSEHLASETNTLVREANYFVNQSIERMLSGAESIRVADESLLQCLPARHRLMSRPSEVFEEADRELEVRIAAYYLDSDAPVKSKESV